MVNGGGCSRVSAHRTKGSLCTTPGRAPDRGLPWVMSFDQAFEQSYRQATIRKASAEQLTMMLLQSEACRVSQHGTITLESGGAIANRSNRYFHADLAEYVGQKVVARFDPQRLHRGGGRHHPQRPTYLRCECLEKVAFGDTQQVCEHKRSALSSSNRTGCRAGQARHVSPRSCRPAAQHHRRRSTRNQSGGNGAPDQPRHAALAVQPVAQNAPHPAVNPNPSSTLRPAFKQRPKPWLKTEKPDLTGL